MEELLKLARETLKNHLKNKKPTVPENLKQKFKEKKACFVTLTKDNELRGCIGSLSPTQELYNDIIDNSINSAFYDPRFSPLSESELNEIKIEISVLSLPKKLEFNNEKDLLSKINENMGLILKKGPYSSTFLPQVWEQIPDKTQFLNNLALKAGLKKDAWKNSEIFFYTVDKIKEK